MSGSSDKPRRWESLRKKVIGLGEESIRKSYYSELQKRLRELQESETRFRAIYNSVNDVIIVHDPITSEILDANQRMFDVLGYTHDEVVGLYPGNLSSGEEPYTQDHAIELMKAAISGEFQTFEWHMRHKSGQLFWMEWNFRLAEIGGKERLLAVGRDITVRKQVEEERRSLEQSLEEQKRRFYRQTILSVTEGKLEICDAEDVKPYIHSALASLDVYEAVDVSNARHKVEYIIRSYGLDEESLHPLIVAVGEVITNAFKHALYGRVYVGRTDNEVWVAVADHGPGIESLVLPSAVLRRGFSTKPSLGMGYSIMLDACDRILLKTGSDGTTVVLIKNMVQRVPKLSEIPDTWETIPASV
ncbi:PAS domain S-box protein [bacterium]|nr:PAS domain S-box protein [bacterium]